MILSTQYRYILTSFSASSNKNSVIKKFINENPNNKELNEEITNDPEVSDSI